MSQRPSSASSPGGPEGVSLFEKLVSFLPLPYPVGCAIFVIVLGSPGFIISFFLDTFDFNHAISATFFSNPLSLNQLQPWQSAFSEALFSLVTFYAFYVIRYMRLKLVRSEAELFPLLPNGEADFHEAFQWIPRSLPLILLTLLIALISLPFTIGRIQIGTGIFWTSINLAGLAINSLGFSTFIWTFLASLRGLYNIGNQNLTMKSYFEDSLFGLRPLGALSLNLTFLFFLGLGLVGLAVLFSPDPYSVAGASGLAIVGVVFFFLPLYSIHRRMVEAKQRESQTIRLQVAKILSDDRGLPVVKGEATMRDLENRLSELKRVQALEFAAKEISSLRTWPFDTQILGRLAVIVLSTTAAIIARIIIVFARL